MYVKKFYDDFFLNTKTLFISRFKIKFKSLIFNAVLSLWNSVILVLFTFYSSINILKWLLVLVIWLCACHFSFRFCKCLFFSSQGINSVFKLFIIYSLYTHILFIKCINQRKQHCLLGPFCTN